MKVSGRWLKYKMRKLDVRRCCRGSYTVEAVFLFPIIIFLVAFLLQISIGWYENVQQAAEDTDVLMQLDTREYFLHIKELQEVKELLVP